MPDRILRVGILTSEGVNQLTAPAEVFYRRLMSIVDDFGRYDGRPAILRAALYPLKLASVSEPDVGKWILETEEAGLVRRYTSQNKQFIELLRFDQRLRAKTSKWPPPPEDADICCHASAGGGHVLSNAAETETRIGDEKAAHPRDGVVKILVPDLLDTPVFNDRWAAWMKHRRRLKKPSDWNEFFQNQLDWLAQYPTLIAIEVLNYSLRNAYTGLIPPEKIGLKYQPRTNRDPNTVSGRLHEQIRVHPANPKGPNYNPGHSPQQKAELDAMVRDYHTAKAKEKTNG